MNKMNQLRTVLFTVSALFIYTFSSAQQVPLFSSYTNNPMLLGPSVIGGEGASNVALLHRIQFQGFEGAPSTTVVLGEFSPEGKNYGFGLQLYSDSRGITTNNGAQLNYAYKVKFSEDFNLGLGLGFALDQWGFDNTRRVVEAINDPSLINTNQRSTSMRADFGTHIEYKKLFVSLSVPTTLSNDIKFDNAANNQELSSGQLRQFMGFVSYELGVNDKVSLTPSVLLRMANNIKPQYDINLKLDYDDKVFATVSYRQGYALSLGGGLTLSDKVKVGYSYDLGVNGYSQYGIGAHEMFVGFRINKGYSE
jgi:type IX secretion system PorP/SprF family membrane protein